MTTATISESPFRSAPNPTRISSEVLATSLFLVGEAMVFASLISAYLVLRSGTATWPPLDQPRLPVFVTAINSVVLLTSGFVVWLGISRLKHDRPGGVWLVGLGGLLGLVFLGIQGYEWTALIGFGLTARSSLYGALFYTLIGTHAAHVAGGLAVMSWMLVRVMRSPQRGGLDATRMYWSFVVMVWPVLYVLVYLV